MIQVLKVTREAIVRKQSIKSAIKEEKGTHPSKRAAEPLATLLQKLKKL